MAPKATDKDLSQDRMIKENAERITRNEEAIRRQTEASEKIRDLYRLRAEVHAKAGDAAQAKADRETATDLERK